MGPTGRLRKWPNHYEGYWLEQVGMGSYLGNVKVFSYEISVKDCPQHLWTIYWILIMWELYYLQYILVVHVADVPDSQQIKEPGVRPKLKKIPFLGREQFLDTNRRRTTNYFFHKWFCQETSRFFSIIWSDKEEEASSSITSKSQ